MHKISTDEALTVVVEFGLGGLTAAIRIDHQGHRVICFESGGASDGKTGFINNGELN